MMANKGLKWLLGSFLSVQAVLIVGYTCLHFGDGDTNDGGGAGHYYQHDKSDAAAASSSTDFLPTQQHATTSEKDNDDFALASHESFGFFDDIPEAAWRLKQHIARSTPHHLDAQYDKVSTYYYRPRGWYQNNWEPDFSCSFESFLGGPIRDGHKWVCDPHRLQKSRQCLVYSFGSNGNFDFENALLKVAPHCELHVFDPGPYSFKMGRYKHLANNPNVTYHTYGMKASYETNASLLDKPNQLPPGQFKTFAEIVAELGHAGRTVDIFKMDIETGEWTTFKDWLGIISSSRTSSTTTNTANNNNSKMNILIPHLQQLLIEVHDAPPIANEFFSALHRAGYAMFHKEPNIQFAGGDCIEFGFVKLRPSFFEGDDKIMPLEHSPQALAHEAKNREEYAANRKKTKFDYGREMRGTGVV